MCCLLLFVVLVFVVRCVLCVVSCGLCVLYVLLINCCWSLCVVCSVLYVFAGRLMPCFVFNVWYMFMFFAHCLLFVVCLLMSAVCCLVFVV